MKNNLLADTIYDRLKKSFSPVSLEVIDDSEHHVGHAGSLGGAKHFTIKITSHYFKHQSRIENHRAIYDILGDLMPHPVHALKIHIASNE